MPADYKSLGTQSEKKAVSGFIWLRVDDAVYGFGSGIGVQSTYDQNARLSCRKGQGDGLYVSKLTNN